MTWNYTPELISALFLLVIIAYSMRYRLVPNRRNRLFIIMIIMVFMLVWLSISTIMLTMHPEAVTDEFNIFIHSLFFIAYPLVPVFFLWYLLCVIFEHNDRLITRIMIFSYLPKLIYDFVVLTNPITKIMFEISQSTGYIAYEGEAFIFIIAIFYMVVIMVLAILNRSILSRPLTLVILSYNLIFIGFLIIEYFYPTLVLGGTAASLFVFILYLYIQNKEMMTDRLTNLMNRSAAVEQLRLLDHSGKSVHLILVSLSDFRTINGLYGQQFGDALLRAISDFLVSVSRVDEVYRYSGDMFLLILRDPGQKVNVILEQIMDRFKSNFTIKGNTTSLRAKFVLAHYPQHVKSSENAVALLEYLITKAKEDPKENLKQSSELSLSDMTRRSQIIEIVKRAVENDYFTIALQPLYSISNGTYTKAEALLRLHDDLLGDISPTEFIPLAEEAGLIIPIGKLVTRKAVEFIKQCNSEGLYLDNISVNYSANHMSQSHLVQDILTVIEQAGIFPSQLKIEITESIFISEYSQIITNIAALNKAGVGFYLDDFGTGFSNLASVVKLPLECIKFDRTLILEAGGSLKSMAMVKGLVLAFKQSGFPTLAEGVETLAQEKMVQELGFDLIQGYLKSKPLTPDECLHFIRTHKNEH